MHPVEARNNRGHLSMFVIQIPKIRFPKTTVRKEGSRTEHKFPISQIYVLPIKGNCVIISYPSLCTDHFS